MNIIKEHINLNLLNFISFEKDSFFDSIFKLMKSEEKETLSPLLKYLFKILNHLLDTNNSNSLISQHIHFEAEYDINEKSTIAEFIWFYFFYKAYNSDSNKSINPELEEKKQLIQRTLEAPIIAPPDNNKRVINQLRYERKKLREHKNFYNLFSDNATFTPSTLMNIKVNQNEKLNNLFEFNPFYLNVNELTNVNSYTIVNNYDFNKIRSTKLLEIPILKVLKNIVLFDCESQVKKFSMFNSELLENLNINHGTDLKSLLVFTFGKPNNSISNFRSGINLIKERFKIPEKHTYTVLMSEEDLLLETDSLSNLDLNFAGNHTSTYWEDFIINTTRFDLYELHSIKLKNIYSVCFNEQIKELIINDIFSRDKSSEFISNETKDSLTELDESVITDLNKSLSYVLDIIINNYNEWTINNSLNVFKTIILDEAIIKNNRLLTKLKKILNSKFKTWVDLYNKENEPFLILSYRDQGRFPYDFQPNLVEFAIRDKTKYTSLLHGFLYKQNYDWAKHNMLKDYYNYLIHPIRNEHFEWNDLNHKINDLKPKKKLFVNWELENEYSQSNIRETFNVKLHKQSSKIYYSSDLIIYSDENNSIVRIERIKWFFDNIDYTEENYKIQKLEELLNEFNPAEKLIDTSQLDQELSIIRKSLGLKNESAGRIWKVLLNQKLGDFNGVEEKLYDDLKKVFIENNIPLVSYNYFVNSWLNLENEILMPRGNKIFRILCEYLGLNNSYRSILYRLKNTSISGQLEATRKYSRLLKDLFSDGCFDENSNIEQIVEKNIEKYRSNHSLDELSINMENPTRGIITLIELIKPEIELVLLDQLNANEL